jgi:hypothetical protein
MLVGFGAIGFSQTVEVDGVQQSINGGFTYDHIFKS